MTSATVAAVICLTALSTIIVCCAPIRNRNKMCNQISPDVLGEILGPAFNSRYMSVSEPQEIDFDSRVPGSLKRAPVFESSFYVDDLYAQEFSDSPAWKTNHLIQGKGNGRKSVSKRAVNVKQVHQWECTSRIRWHDLGPDYYPRYLRSVECTSSTCWYDMMRCRPRSFTVKLLRRKNSCVKDDGGKSSGGSVGSVGLPQELRELWVWEERAVNFCCDCAV